MKTGKFTLAILSAAICFASCSKEDSINDMSSDNGSAPVSARAAAPATLVSSWEGGYSWNLSDSSDFKVYAYTKSFPELSADVMENGAVLVFVKNVSYEGTIIDKPMLTPFHIMPPEGRPGYDQMWYRVVSEGNVTVKYRTNKHIYGGSADLPNGNEQFRYFIIPGSELDKLGYTPTSIRQLSYGQLVQLFGTQE